jgi:hypothetical protein
MSQMMELAYSFEDNLPEINKRLLLRRTYNLQQQ